ncbi:MAG: alpha/beta hydrolase [Pseudomonadales bacterium]
MAKKHPQWPAGQVVQLAHESAVLKDNPLGDPAARTVTAWLPPGYAKRKQPLPVLFDLVGYTGSGPSHTNWQNFSENVPERLDRLTFEKKLGPCIVVFPDCFTALGGNQYINSSAIGRYADYLTRELIPFVETEFKTHGHRDHRACFGKSSGGYGAMVHGMRYSDYWGAIGNHSGDAYFDFVYRSDWPRTLTHLSQFVKAQRQDGKYKPAKPTGALKRGLDDGRVARFLKHVWKTEKPSGDEIMTLMILAMAATYDPDRKAPNGFRLPFDLETGELIEARWRAWLKHDPLNMVSANVKALKSLRGIFIDCGWRDQYHIHFGSRQLAARLQQRGIKHRYEEFADTHSGIDYRMDISLPYLYKAIR